MTPVMGQKTQRLITWYDMIIIQTVKYKLGGICIYCKHFLLLRIHDAQYFQEYINFEMTISNSVCNFISLYRSPSQT